MRRNKIEKKYIVLIILILIALFLAFLFSIIKSDRNLTPAEQMIKDTFAAISKTVYKPINLIKDKAKQDREKNDLYEKYQKQQEKIANVDSLQAKQADLEKQLAEMKKLLELNNSSFEYEYLNATVVNRNVGYWYNTITVDKGKNSGVQKDMVVMVADGLIGKVTKVTNFTSTVKLLTNNDTTMPLSVKINIGDKYIFGILNGYDNETKRLIVEGISGNDKIPVNSSVVTTGLSDNSPSGVLIGKVESVKTDNFGLAKIVEISSKVNFDDINYVTILKRKANDN